jgi:hypothetical protein
MQSTENVSEASPIHHIICIYYCGIYAQHNWGLGVVINVRAPIPQICRLLYYYNIHVCQLIA